MVTLKVEIDQDTHRELKVIAARESKKIKEVVLEAIKRYLESRKKKLSKEFLKLGGIVNEGEIHPKIREIFEDPSKVKKIWE